MRWSRLLTLLLACHSQSVREAKAASHVLQTVWSYKELRSALQKDGWTKARFQVCNSSWFPALTLLDQVAKEAFDLTSFLYFVFQSAATTSKGPKGAQSPGGFDDSTLPLVDKSLGE